MMLQSFAQVRATMLRPCLRTSSFFNSQHVKRRNRVAKRMQQVAPNNVAICFVYRKRSSGRGLSSIWVHMGPVLKLCYDV